MTIKEHCQKNTIGYVNVDSRVRIEIKDVECGDENYIYCISIINNIKKYHKCKVNCGDKPYFILYGNKIFL